MFIVAQIAEAYSEPCIGNEWVKGYIGNEWVKHFLSLNQFEYQR